MEPEGSTQRIGADASAAMKQLAHATIAIDDPADLYPLVGDLLGSLRSLVQVADQLAHAHMRHRGRARSDDDPALGGQEADETAWALVRVRELLDAAENATELASESAGQVAWLPADKSERWLSVVLLQGEQAAETLDILDRSGAQAAIHHLAHWDAGDETTEAALNDGYIYDGIPTCRTDHTAEDRASGYALISNPTLRYVSLLRRFPQIPDPDLVAVPSAAAPAAPERASAFPSWSSAHWGHHRTPARSIAL
ncbi:hypothetical protein [Microbacterium pygmaeum]|uniref:Uncharacterized protein n=1 Tax=Microbacterium pygmaeum TaxID=370764 RepID=A0A1G7XGH0_9MICO|nr:hypothetical protein [Microbacterium pygmaeum]SDG83338.1 hypothetical protein SAMN04489810_1417 [Microbacterium pygmaeum]